MLLQLNVYIQKERERKRERRGGEKEVAIRELEIAVI